LPILNKGGVKGLKFKAPNLSLQKRDLTRDEWWYIPIVFFILRVYSTSQMNSVIDKCESRGGTAIVTEAMFGSSWSVKCVK
jgi:hypothetical protein